MKKIIALIIVLSLPFSAHSSDVGIFDSSCEIVAGLIAADVAKQAFSENYRSDGKLLKTNIKLYEAMDCGSSVLRKEIEDTVRKMRKMPRKLGDATKKGMDNFLNNVIK